nr:hypothetical protein [Tanacetum cinerariifolium]
MRHGKQQSHRVLLELIYKVHGLHVLFLELDRFEILLGEREEGQVDLQEKCLGYEIQSSFASITSNDHGFTVDRDMDDYLVTENFGMILGQPIHIDDNVETTEFNRHEINFERHDKRLSLGTSFTEWDFSSVPIVFSWCGSIGFDSFLPLVLLWLVVIVAVVEYALLPDPLDFRLC